jgi:hypothetical protein
MGNCKLCASLWYWGRNINREALTRRATVEVGGVWSMEEDVPHDTSWGGARGGGARLQTNGYRHIQWSSESALLVIGYDVRCIFLGNCNIKKHTGRSISTVRLEPAATEAPSAGDPITTFCASAVVMRRVIEATTLINFIVLGAEVLDSEWWWGWYFLAVGTPSSTPLYIL